LVTTPGFCSENPAEGVYALRILRDRPMSRQHMLLALGIATGLLFLWLALREANLAEIVDALSTAQWWQAGPFLVALFTFYWIKTARWRALLSPIRELPTRTLFPAVMIGYAGSTVLPMQLGELLRTYVTGRTHDLRVSAVLASILLERVFDLLTILVLLSAALLLGTTLSEAMLDASYLIAGLVFVCVAIISFTIFRPESFVKFCETLLMPLPQRLRASLLEQINLGTTGLASLRAPRLLRRVIVTSLAQWACMALCCYISLTALNIDVPLSAASIVLIFTVISVTLPTSPGFVGSIQLAYTLALAPYGVSAGIAFAASVFFHVLAYFSVLIVGFFFMYRFGYTFNAARVAALRQ